MRCPTEEIDINGQKVVINVSDFDHKTMKRWDYSDSVVPAPVAPAPVAPTPVAPTPVAPAPVAPTPVAPAPKMKI